MVKEYGITEYDAQVLTFSKALADQFETAARAANIRESFWRRGVSEKLR